MNENQPRRKKNGRWSRQALTKKFVDMDWYGEPVSFNFAGQERIPSTPGCVLTTILTLTLIGYAMSSFSQMITHSNPLITIATIQNYFDSTNVVNFDNFGFKVAFFVQGYIDNEPKDDPDKVQWVIQLNTCKGCNGYPVATNLTTHKCTDADFDSFYPPDPSYVSTMKQAKKDKFFWCIDDGQGIEVFG